jgi:hypothetical protein
MASSSADGPLGGGAIAIVRAPILRSGRRLFGIAPAFASTSKEKRTPRNPVALVLLKRRYDF